MPWEMPICQSISEAQPGRRRAEWSSVIIGEPLTSQPGRVSAGAVALDAAPRYLAEAGSFVTTEVECGTTASVEVTDWSARVVLSRPRDVAAVSAATLRRSNKTAIRSAKVCAHRCRMKMSVSNAERREFQCQPSSVRPRSETRYKDTYCSSPRPAV